MVRVIIHSPLINRRRSKGSEFLSNNKFSDFNQQWNTDEMVSPALEPPQVETKEHQNYNDGDEEEPDDWEWEHQKNLGKVYEGGKRGGFRFQGNDEAGVYDDSYGFDVGGDEPLSKGKFHGKMVSNC